MPQWQQCVIILWKEGEGPSGGISEHCHTSILSVCIQQRSNVSGTQRTWNPWMRNEPKDSKSHTQAPQWQQCVIIFWKEEGGRVISERSYAFFVSACIQQRFSVSGTLAKDLESMDEKWTQGFKKSYTGTAVAAVCYNILKRRGGEGYFWTQLCVLRFCLYSAKVQCIRDSSKGCRIHGWNMNPRIQKVIRRRRSGSSVL